MLVYLHVRGLALLDDVALELGPGMNVLTGETGAGKSIIVDALTLLRGARGRAELVRKGASSARVEAQFELDESSRARIEEAIGSLDLDPSWREGLVIERVVGKAGRGRSVIHSRLTTQGMLERVGGELVDICSQHEYHSLTNVSRHLDLLDAYAGLDRVDGPRREYAAAYELWHGCTRSLAALQERTREGVARADYLRFQIEEIERVAPLPGEYEGLRERLTLLRDAQRWVAFARQAHEMLYEADDAIAARLAGLVDEARRGPGSSSLLAEIGEQLSTAQIACEEAASAANRFAAEVEIEPGELDLAEERLHELEGLRRKHRLDLDELAERAETMRAELTELDNADEHLEALAARERELRAQLSERAKVLSDARRGASAELARAIEGELRALHLADARLEVEVEALDEPGPRGADQVEFLFTANRGEAAAPLTKVASGGELSRVLLAFKGVLATGDHITTYVFDEVDAGVGGAVAEAIGRRLYAASRGRQVLCITHLPQIAAFADAHFRVDKVALDGRTVTRVERLDDGARVEELARMLGGARVTASAREHAVQLIAEARRSPAGRSGDGDKAGAKGTATAKGNATAKTTATAKAMTSVKATTGTTTPSRKVTGSTGSTASQAAVKGRVKAAAAVELKGAAGSTGKTGKTAAKAKAKAGAKAKPKAGAKSPAKAKATAKSEEKSSAKPTKTGRGARARSQD